MNIASKSLGTIFFAMMLVVSSDSRSLPSQSQLRTAGGVISVAGSPQPDNVDWLITPVEARKYGGEEGFIDSPALRPRAAVPLIEVVKPEPVPDLKVKAPFSIAVRFKAQPDSPIVPDSFRILYGGFKIDITQRVLKFVKITPDGFVLEDAKIPSGKHRLTMQIQDFKQQMGERELRFEVE